MKKIALLFIGISFAFGVSAQDGHEEGDREKKVASVSLKDMEGNTVNTAELGFDGPVIISFWATWCSPCKRELNTIHDLYTDWQEETGVNLVAVSIDDEKDKGKVPMYANGKGWEYLVLMDPNGDFKRAMGVNNVPHTFLVDKNGVIVYSHNNYAPGDEEELYKRLVELSEKEQEFVYRTIIHQIYYMKKIVLCLAVVTVSLAGYGQENGGSFTGNIETIFQYLNKDSIIDADQPDQKGLLNSYMNVFYTNGNFRAGMRFEAYLPRIQGYPSNFDGVGIGMRYVGYSNDFVDVTLGSIYEQFGQGLSLRAYENMALGYDNFIDGARIIVTPHSGVRLKGVYGYQRFAFQGGRIEHGEGLVRGLDGEVNLNRAFKQLANKKLDVTLGGSFVSKYQRDNNPDLILPENVGTYGGRANLRYGKFNVEGEYIIKEQDPSQDNNNIYNYGHATVINAAYSQKGLGIILQAKSVDNMSYRSDRSKQLQNLLINYLPAMTKTHTYNLVSSLYPYATQPVGEIAFQAEVLYTIKKGSKLGGKYGTSVNVNYSTAYRPERDASSINPLDSTGVAYVTKPFQMSDSLYWRDFNINIYKKFSKSFNLTLAYYNMLVNNDVATVSKETGNIRSNVFIAEMGFKFKNHQSMRIELQGLVTGRRSDDLLREEVSFFAENTKAEDKGDWATVLVEYNINSNWFVSVMDQYNFGNGFLSKTKKGKPVAVHHPYLTVGYVRGSTRLTASYGRQRAGLFCVGGVCRPVPASNGLTFSFTQSFQIMKKYIVILIGTIAGTLSFTSCDHVDNPFPPGINTDLDTNLYPGNWSDYVANEWPDFTTLPNDDPNRNVILEDFTGHNCPGCPAAATVAHNLHEGNPSRVFVVSVHAGPTISGTTPFQEVNLAQGYTIDFMNVNGLALGSFFGVTLPNTGFFANPSGAVNRSLLGTEMFYGTGVWGSQANQVLGSPLGVAIKAKVNYYDATKGLFLHTEIEKLDVGLNIEDLAQVVYLIEDSLVGPQNVSSTFTPDYIHRDIMRGCIDGSTWGRDVIDGELVGGKYQLDYSYVVPDQLAPEGQPTTHNAENMHLLIYVYDKNTYEIYQVIKKKIVP